MSAALNPALLPPGASGPAGSDSVDRLVRARDRATVGRPSPAPDPSAPSFAAVLKGATDATESAGGTAAGAPLRFSKHALARVERRGISLDPATLGRLSEGVGRAAGKGSRDSVVLVDGTAFVVSVNNRTVVTAVGPEHMREHVFTNVDSAVIA